MTKISKTSIASILVGTILEWYDFSLLACMAPLMATLFFPMTNPSMSLLATFGVMASGFFARPIGGVIFGHIGDRYGRTTALSMTIILMVIPTVSIGLLPTYQTIGVIAPVLLVVCRLLQGFASSGEYPGAICYLTEIAPQDKKGIWGSASMFSVAGGILLGTAVNAILSAYLTTDQMYAYGWRIPFLIGLPLGIVGWYLRYYTQDSEIFRAVQEAKKTLKMPIREVLRSNLLILNIVIALFALGTVSYYMGFVYVTTYLVTTHQIPLHTTMITSSIGTIVMIVLIPLIGSLSDRINRTYIMFAGALAMCIFFYPVYQLLLAGNAYDLLLGQSLLGALIALFVGPVAATASEAFTTNVRYSGVAVALNIGSSIFGGTCPLVATYIASRSGNVMMPAFYPILIAAICLAAVSYLRIKQRV